jgi:hypothetical protein
VQKPPRVSVVVPAFNAAPYLEQALASALGQTMPDLEVVVVDDGSTDSTATIADCIAARDPRVRVLRNERNLGQVRARARAHAAARGEWLASLDADDAWMPERLERLLSTSGAAEADAIADDALRVEVDRGLVWSCLRDRWQTPLVLTGPTWLGTQDLIRHHLGVLQPLIRRSFVEEHAIGFPQVSLAEDFYFYVEMLLAGARWLQVPEGYYLYFVRPCSITAAWVDMGTELLAHHTALFDHPRVRADPSVSAVLRTFVSDERASLLLESARRDLQRGHPIAAAYRLLRQPRLLLRAALLALRRVRARLARRRSRLRLRGDPSSFHIGVVAD